MRVRSFAAGLVCLGLLFSALPAWSQSESWGYDIAHELMSPYCPGRTLATCPSPQAAELVQWIVLQEASGATREQVVEMLVERFGEEILGAPRAEGDGVWAYVTPVVAFFVIGVLAALALRRIVRTTGSPGLEPVPAAAGVPLSESAHSASNPASAPLGTSEDDDLARIIDDELAQRS